jgi:hypothetical protein
MNSLYLPVLRLAASSGQDVMSVAWYLFFCAVDAGSRTCRIQAASASAHAAYSLFTCPLYDYVGVGIVSVSSLFSCPAILASLFAFTAKERRSVKSLLIACCVQAGSG